MGLSGSQALLIILTLTVGPLQNFAPGQLSKSKRRRCSASTSRPEDMSGEGNEALRRDLESASQTDDASREEYDVFLSFRGSDTRLNFTDCLYHSMLDAGIRVFLDSEELEPGEKISKVLNALNKSRIYIPIFSKNFASSIWCLREVERMVECYSKSNGKKDIIPIFYDVNTDDVKLRTGLYENALIEHKKSDPDEVERWRNALKTVGGIIGREIQEKGQGEEIKSIVEQVSSKLKTRHMIVTKYLVEDNGQVQAIMKLLDVGSDGVHFVGIYGLGGVGKTTLATVLYNKLSFHFEACSVLKDVRAHWQPPGGPLDLQKKLLSDSVSSTISDQIKNVDDGIKMIERVFSNKKVLIVLDDLDKIEQLEKLAGNPNWFGSGSRILITTRDKSILMTQVESSSKEVLHQPKGISHYEVCVMEDHLALQLFCKHAFRSDSPIKDYDALSKDIVRKVDRLPLAVEVIGSSLYYMGFALESHGDKRKLLEEMLKQLDEGPVKGVRDVLMISYEGLEKKQKEVFLDIACFFTNVDQTYPVIMWNDCNYHPHTAIRVLHLRSLIKIRDNKFWMHDQLRDLGRHIILEEYPRKFSRVWIHEDVVKLLERKEGNQDVEALSLTPDGYSRNIALEELASPPNLRFLQVKGIDIFGNFKNPLWQMRQMWQMNFHPYNFNNLVMLDLSNSDIEDGWGGWSKMKVTEKLKVLDLTGCKKLTKTPDFSNFTSLESLILARCPKLITIDRSIGKLKYLKTLNIKGCSSLRELPEEVGSLHSLTEIVMPQNFQSLKLPERFGELKSLSSFILNNHPRISQLPKSIVGLVKLTCLSLRGCVGIKELPPSIGELQMLVELDVSKSGIVILPDSVGKLKKLRLMRLAYTATTKFPSTIGQVEALEELVAKKCWDLTDENLEEIGKLSHLRILDLSFTRVCRLPEVIGGLSHLQTLELGSIELQQVTALPSSLRSLSVHAVNISFKHSPSSLVNLENLELNEVSAFLKEEPYSTWRNDPPKMEEAWNTVQPIHQLPSRLSTLKLKGISPLPCFGNLESLSVLHVSEFPMQCLHVSEGLIHLRELKISRCKDLREITNLSRLESLQRLVLNSLNNLVKIPGLSELKSLQRLCLSRCCLIEELPNLLKLDKLQYLELEGCPNLRAIRGVEGLESLELNSDGRTVLERLLDVSRTTWLPHKLLMYDVFLSFRGPDTRYNIISFIDYSLYGSPISIFRDDDELSPGEGIGEEIQQALNNSYIYIPVFSRNYASSQWCLRELVHMVKCTSRSKGKRKILPIFYDVEIDDVKLKSNLYTSVLDRHRENFPTEVDVWEKTLKEVAHMEGLDMKTDSGEDVVQKIIAEVSRANKLLDVDS
ncbi:disease resistance protein L6-like [Syzygium oleosum]|uniref:disease resistance protein L6-like n=1 Tax=Syzygium oleosum TaxID=219896 RepID=UPI0011D227FA|nr:disease resistance protein L6-like [Syzygium oleosum]